MIQFDAQRRSPACPNAAELVSTIAMCIDPGTPAGFAVIG